VACVLVFLLLTAVFSAPLLIMLAIYIFWAGSYPLAHFWPANESASTYANVILAGACMAGAFAAKLPSIEAMHILCALGAIAAAIAYFVRTGQMSNGQRCRRAQVIALVCIIAIGWGIPAIVAGAVFVAFSMPPLSRMMERAARAAGGRSLYAGAVFAVLAVMVILPSCGLFKIAYHAVSRLELEKAQLDRIDLLDHRADKIRAYFAAVPFKNLKDRDKIAQTQLSGTLDRYDIPVFWPDEENDTRRAEVEPEQVTQVERWIAIVGGWLGLDAEILEVALADAGDGAARWKHQHAGDREVVEASHTIVADVAVNPQTLRGFYPIWRFPWQASLLILPLAAVLAGWLRFMIPGCS
jgi:hypothetical protein